MFSKGIERGFHFMVPLKENICSKWVDQKRYVFQQIPNILLIEIYKKFTKNAKQYSSNKNFSLILE